MKINGIMQQLLFNSTKLCLFHEFISEKIIDFHKMALLLKKGITLTFLNISDKSHFSKQMQFVEMWKVCLKTSPTILWRSFLIIVFIRKGILMSVIHK